MKTQRKIWIAGLVTAGFTIAAAPSLAVSGEAPLLHPLDKMVQTTSHTPADLDLTRRIRNALVASEALTDLGKNVSIDARDGNVTLTGTVSNLRERTLVGDIATRVAGPGRVTNELEFLRVS